ncbi:MAG: DegQ family serine endoprotease [Thioalkalispiraceae bacterium]|jgi:serine protease Do/serine protease DegQ
MFVSRVKVFFIVLISIVSFNTQAALPFFDSEGNRLPSLAPMLDEVTPAVVNIATQGRVQVQQNPLLNDPFFRRFFDVPEQPRHRKTQSLGSGVVVDAKNGYIITNNHVIDKADEISVTLRSGEILKARLIGTDPDTDVAVIQVESDKLTEVPLGNSDRLRVGDFAIAIGNPFGLGQTVTSGIVSALGRSGLGIEGYEDFIQTDASINPGNSGGALVNLRGELIGINTAIFSRSGGNIGIGFAIPINMVKDVMQQLVKHGEVRRGRLGAQAQDLTPQLAKAFNLKYRRGAIITQVVKGSAADKAGLKAGDIVTQINGKRVKDADTLRNAVGLLRVGEQVKLEILREGSKRTLSASVEEPKLTQQGGDKLHAHLQGAQLADIVEGSALFGQVEGIVVSGVAASSPAWRAGLRKGDVIVSANRKAVHNLVEFKQAIQGNDSLLLNVRRGKGALFLYLQ